MLDAVRYISFVAFGWSSITFQQAVSNFISWSGFKTILLFASVSTLICSCNLLAAKLLSFISLSFVLDNTNLSILIMPTKSVGIILKPLKSL